METHIRAAKPADAGAMARVHVDTWRTTYAGIVPAEHLAGLSYQAREKMWAGMLAAAAPPRSEFVAETDTGEVVGFASGGPEREGSPTYRGELYAIYVRAAVQGQGVGRRLVSAVAQHLVTDGFDTMLIWVLQDNPSCRFYEALGGTWVGSKTIAIGGAELVEVAYGWTNIANL